MRILVFDDKELHRNAAEAQLKGHDVTIVTTYQQAERLLVPQFDMSKYEDLLTKGIPAEDAQKAALTPAQQFDVILTDLLVPAPTHRMSQLVAQKFFWREMPVGMLIGLLGASRAGVKYVGVVTDAS